MNEENTESGERLLKNKRRERKVRQGKKKRSLMRGFLRFLTAVGILGFVCWFLTLPGWYLPHDAFTKLDPAIVRVVDNKIVKPAKIRAVFKDIEVPKLPIFLTGLNRVKRHFTELAPVEEVYVRRYAFPARVQVLIREAIPVVTIAPDINVSPVAAYTKDGRLITGAEYMPLPKEYKTILVLSYGNKGDDYRKWDENKIREIERITKYVETFSREPVEYIDMRNPSDIYVKVKSVNIRLGHPDNKIYERIKRLPSILPEAKKVENKVRYIDLSWDDVNYLKLK